ncbi:histidinol-phosphate transaminase [bacterium]|nr:histidinol-phosphate transaminase [bacterium]
MLQVRKELSNLKEYVPGKSVEEIQEAYGLAKVTKLASNENPLGPGKKAVAAIQDLATQSHLYPRGDMPSLREVAAKTYGINPQQFFFGNGSDEVISYLAQVFLNPEDEVISSNPTFSEYKFSTLVAGAKYVPVDMLDWNHDLEAIQKEINPATKMIFICNPNNPTGTYLGEKKLIEFIGQVSKDILIVVDEAYAEYATANDYPDLPKKLEELENVLLLRTFSKLHGIAGLRVGYAMSSSKLISHMMKVRQPFNVNLLAQAAATAALKDEEHIKASYELNVSEMKRLVTEFEGQGYNVLDSQANFLTLKIGENAAELVQYLESKGMIIRHLKSFGMNEWVRVTVGLVEENDLLIDLMRGFSK